jgi:hypothetical protein
MRPIDVAIQGSKGGIPRGKADRNSFDLRGCKRLR